MLAKNPHLALTQCLLGTTLALAILGLALRGALAQVAPAPPYEGSWRYCTTNTYRTITWGVTPPNQLLRTNRLKIKKGAGSEGLRAEWANSAPVVLMSSVDGCPRHAEAVVSNGVTAVAVPAGKVVLWRLRQ